MQQINILDEFSKQIDLTKSYDLRVRKFLITVPRYDYREQLTFNDLDTILDLFRVLM